MKKIIYFILLVAMLCSISVSTSAASRNIADTIMFLNAVGFETGYDPETIDESVKITRANYVDNVIRLLNLDDQIARNTYYHDVSKDHWAFNSIGIMSEKGWIIGDGNNNFYPERLINKQQTVKIMIDVLGYSFMADALGGFPEGYMKIANQLELLDGCTSTNELTYPDMYKIFENALKINVTEMTTVKGKFGYKEDSDTTLLSKYYGMYYDRGTLTGCDNVSLTQDNKLENDVAEIDGLKYDTSLEGLIPSIGTEIEFLYMAESIDDTDRELVWVKNRNRNDILEIRKDMNDKYNTDSFIFNYEDDGRYKDIKLFPGIIVIYNGSLYDGSLAEMMSKNYYNVRFINSKLLECQNGAKYNIAVIDCYENMVVGDVNIPDKIIYDKFDVTKSITIDENDWDRITIDGGKTIEDINSGDVISIYKSSDGKKIRLLINSEIKQAVLKTISTDGSTVISTEDNDFELYDSALNMNAKIGDSVEIYFDAFGYAAYVKRMSSQDIAAYIINVKYDMDNDKVLIKYLSQDGEIETKTCKEKLKLDGYIHKDMTVVKNLFVDAYNKTIQQLVLLKINQDDEIASIDTLSKSDEEDAESTLRLYKSNYYYWYKNSGKFGPYVVINDKTKIFSVSSTSSDDQDYTIKSKSNLKNDTMYTMDIYRYRDEKQGYEDIMVIKDWDWGLSQDSAILIEKIKSTLNSDDEVVEEVTGYDKGAKVTYITDGKYSLQQNGIEVGDVFFPDTNTKGELKGAELKFDYDGNSRTWDAYAQTFNNNGRMITGYANEICDDVIKLGRNSGADFDELFMVPNNCITVYDPDGIDGTVRKGTMSDIKTYESDGNNCSTVILFTYGAEVRSAIVYK